MQALPQMALVQELVQGLALVQALEVVQALGQAVVEKAEVAVPHMEVAEQCMEVDWLCKAVAKPHREVGSARASLIEAEDNSGAHIASILQCIEARNFHRNLSLAQFCH